MGLNWAPAQGADTCTGSVTPGARALAAWLEEVYPTGYSLGIYNCRNVRGGSTTSLHGEGRAYDQGIPLIGGRANPLGHEIIAHVGQHGRRLGVQRAIFDRTNYRDGAETGRYYGGVHPHDDHIHWELTWASARNLNLATLRAVLGGANDDAVHVVKAGDTLGAIAKAYGTSVSTLMQLNPQILNANVISVGMVIRLPGSIAPKPPTPPPATSSWPGSLVAKLATVSRATAATVRTRAIEIVQALLAAHGFVAPNTFNAHLQPDGKWGDGTEATVRAFQKAKGLTVDGIVGAKTWRKLTEGLPTRRRGYGPATSVRVIQALFAAWNRNLTHSKGNGRGDNAMYDGRFGGGVESDVRNFQRLRGLKVDGIVGQDTYTRLFQPAFD